MQSNLLLQPRNPAFRTIGHQNDFWSQSYVFWNLNINIKPQSLSNPMIGEALFFYTFALSSYFTKAFALATAAANPFTSLPPAVA